jgi:DNA polymerase III epsilon subunit-like protein
MRRSPRRTREWRWEPPGATVDTVDETSRQRWAEARAKAIAWSIEVANDPRVVYLDTETTGFGARAEIVDIALVNATGRVVFESLVRPTRRIPREVIAIHGITDADVADAPDWADVYQDVLPLLEGRRIVVYNVTFDRQMVTQSCSQYDLTAPAADWDCAMRRYAGFFGSWDSDKRWYRFQKLERAVLTFGAEPGGHRAAADALACRTVVLGMAATPPPAMADGEALAAPTIAGTTADDAAWDDAEPLPFAPSAADGSIALARWARAARWFRATLEATPQALRERPGACGGWAPRDVAAHCAGWEWEAARRVRLVAAHAAMSPASYDIEGFNAASVAVRARQSWTETLDDLGRASGALARAAATALEDPTTIEWLGGRAADFEAHAVALRRWLDEITFPAAVDRFPS